MKIKSRRGFTLVELNLAVFFVAILILGIAYTTIQVTRIYQKGMTVKTVNQVGREIVGQMRRDFASANPSVVKLTEVKNGRLCLGSASYLYNDAVTLNDDSKTGLTYDGEEVTLARVVDATGEFCQRHSDGSFVRPVIDVPTDDITELLENDIVALAVHDLAAETYASNQTAGLHQALYRLSLTLGTNEIDTTTETGQCRPPTDNQANFEACFVSEFETIIRAGEVAG